MRVFLRADRHDDYRSINFAIAAEGFKMMGWELRKYQDIVGSILPDLDKEAIVVDFMDESRQAFQQLGIVPPTLATYPAIPHPRSMVSR